MVDIATQKPTTETVLTGQVALVRQMQAGGADNEGAGGVTKTPTVPITTKHPQTP